MCPEGDRNMETGFHIRKATQADADALFDLLMELAISFQPSREAFDFSLRELLSTPDCWLCVAEEDQAIVGYCLGFDHYTFYANGRVSLVEEIIVKPGKRRTGIGQSLIGAFEKWAEARNSKLVAIATSRAAPFYLALGYKERATVFRKILPSSRKNTMK